MGKGFKHGRGRNRSGECGDATIVELRTNLHESERIYIRTQEAETTSRAAYKKAAAHLAEVSDKNNGNPSEIRGLSAKAEKLRQKIALCSDEAKIDQYNADLQAIFSERDALKDEVREAERAAASRERERRNATRRREAAKGKLQDAKQRHDNFFIDKAGVPRILRDKVAVIVESRSGTTHVRSCTEDLPKLCVSIRRDGSIVRPETNPFEDYLIDTYGDHMAAD